MSNNYASRVALRAAIAQREMALQEVGEGQTMLARADIHIANLESAVATYAAVQREAVEIHATALGQGDCALTLPDDMTRKLAEGRRADGGLPGSQKARTALAARLVAKQHTLAAADAALKRAVAAVAVDDAAAIALQAHQWELSAAAMRTYLHSIDAATPTSERLPPIVVDTLREPPINTRVGQNPSQVKAWADYRARLHVDPDAPPPAIPALHAPDAATAAAAERKAVAARIEAAEELTRHRQALARRERG